MGPNQERLDNTCRYYWVAKGPVLLNSSASRKTFEWPALVTTTGVFANRLANEITSSRKLDCGLGHNFSGRNPPSRGLGHSGRWQGCLERRQLAHVSRQSGAHRRGFRQSARQVVAALELQDGRSGQIVRGDCWRPRLYRLRRRPSLRAGTGGREKNLGRQNRRAGGFIAAVS